MKKQVLVSVDRGETRVALLESTGTVGARKPGAAASSRRRRRSSANPAAGYDVAELYLERRGARSIVGNIYKGRVDNVLAGLEAAFVDIGLEKNGFLHVDEIVLPGVEAPRRGRGQGKDSRQITDLLKPGQEIVVQVVKDPLKTKGARLSMDLTIAGRYMVYAPFGEGVGVSRRLEDGERDRLRKEAAKLELRGAGAIIRTAAHGAKRADLERELLYLFKLGEVLQKRVAETPAPALVFQEADLSVRVVRDIFSGDFERAIVDDAKAMHRLVSFFSRTAPELVEHVELWEEEEQPLFEAFGVEKVLESTLSRRVDLPSGGYLMIDYAEALTVIDVNSGSFIGRGKGARLEDTITKTNLEAADEVVKQLRLRDIGGIIVIDFIDMARARNRDAVLKTLRKALDEDRTKTFVVEISPLGLVEMTRQNVTDGVREIMTRSCPVCGGEGVIKSEETIAIEFERRMRDLAKTLDSEALLLQMNPRVSAEFTGDGARVLEQIEAETGKWFHFEGSEGLPLEHFRIVMEATREEVLERALPFRAGEEVHVEIVEPHMYRPGDAVAKIDGYIISVASGTPFVGEKHLVRIERVGRTEADAVLVDVPEEELAAAAAKAARAARPPSAVRRRAGLPRVAAALRGAGSSGKAEGGDGGDDTAGEAGGADAAERTGAGGTRRAAGRRGGSRAGAGRDGAERDGADDAEGEGLVSELAGRAPGEDPGLGGDGEAETKPAPRRSRGGRGRGGGRSAAAPRDPDAEAATGEDDDDAPAPRTRRAAAGRAAGAGGGGGARDTGSSPPVTVDPQADGSGDSKGSEGSGRGSGGGSGTAGGGSGTEAGDDVLESKPRRRGRRGGRRRSAAKSESGSAASSPE